MTRLLTRRTVRTVLGLLLLVEAIFLAESFTTIMEQTIRNGGSALDLGYMLLLKSPEVIDFALPLALMLGLYFAITTARDDNELVICAAAGVSWKRIPAFAGAVGMVGLVASLIFSGLLTPLSAFSLRLSLYDLQARLILQEVNQPGQRNSLRTIEGQTIIATPSADPDAKRGNLFVYKAEPGGGWRVNQANDWTVIGPDADGGYSVRMTTFRETSGTAADQDVTLAKEPASIREALQSLSMNVSTVSMAFRLEDLLQAVDTARRDNELLIYDVMGGLTGLAKRHSPKLLRLSGEILGRGLLCLIAAFIAVAAAAWSATRAGRFTALPGAIVLLLAYDIALRALLGDAAQLGAAMFWAIFAAATLIGLGLPIAYILKRAEHIITPRRGRA